MSAEARRRMRMGDVERWAASGMPVAEWCELNGVGQSTLYYWIGRFRDEEPQMFPECRQISPWVDATPAVQAAPEPVPAPAARELVVEIGGARLSVPWDGDPAALSAVVSALRA